MGDAEPGSLQRRSDDGYLTRDHVAATMGVHKDHVGLMQVWNDLLSSARKGAGGEPAPVLRLVRTRSRALAPCLHKADLAWVEARLDEMGRSAEAKDWLPLWAVGILTDQACGRGSKLHTFWGHLAECNATGRPAMAYGFPWKVQAFGHGRIGVLKLHRSELPGLEAFLGSGLPLTPHEMKGNGASETPRTLNPGIQPYKMAVPEGWLDQVAVAEALGVRAKRADLKRAWDAVAGADQAMLTQSGMRVMPSADGTGGILIHADSLEEFSRIVRIPIPRAKTPEYLTIESIMASAGLRDHRDACIDAFRRLSEALCDGTETSIDGQPIRFIVARESQGKRVYCVHRHDVPDLARHIEAASAAAEAGVAGP